MKTTFIYSLIDPRSGIPAYIGKSNKPKRRYKEHLREIQSKTVNKKVNWLKALDKLGLKPRLEILDEVYRESWELWEMFYISFFKNLGVKLKNGTSGGSGTNEEVNFRIAQTLKGRKQTLEVVQKRIATRKQIQKETGLWAPIGTYEQVAATRIKNGKKWTKKSSEKMSKSMKKAYSTGTRQLSGGAAKPYEQRKATNARVVCEYSLSGTFVREWESVSQATHHYKPSGQAYTIICACKGKYNKTYNSIWRYKEPKIDELPNTLESIQQTIDKLSTSKKFYSQNLREQQKKINYTTRKKRGSINC